MLTTINILRGGDRRPWAVAVWTAVMLLVAAACSSTSKTADRASAGEVTEDTSASADASPDAPSTPGTRGTTSAAASSGSEPSPITARPPVVEGGGAVRMGRGVTKDTIKIGFNYAADLGAAYATVGFGGSAEGTNERSIIDALVKYFNKSGGIAGRKIVPVYFEYDAASSDTWDSLAQQACEKFVRDEKVFAVVSGHVGQTDSLLACLAEGKTPLVQQNQWPYDGKYFAEFARYLYQPSRMRPERWVPVYIGGLKDAGYFTAGYKLGLLRFDAPVFGRIKKLMDNEFRKRGLKLTSEAVIHTPQSVGEFGQMSAQLQSAVLRFQQAGVTHVIFDEYAAIIPFFFTTIAEDQGFRPRYGFTSVNLPGTIEQQAGPSQLNKALAISWLPGQDVHLPQQDPRAEKANTFTDCLKVIAANGYPNPQRLYASTHCDNLFFLNKAFAKTNDITPEGLLAAAEKLGESYDSPYTWATRFATGRTDGAREWRLLRYDPKPCPNADGCFYYSGGSHSAG
ncbi:MAG TPA: ABC transporter substrate-binding protein [Actinomycetota bacterium]|nr:ABC transporter substrate-binding protein [Actinomycetota bacterium]